MIEEVDGPIKTIPGVVLDSSPVNYRHAHGVLGETRRERKIAARGTIAQELFIDSIRAKWGNISSVASELDLPRAFVEQRIKNDPELWQEYVDAQEKKIDLLEDSIFDKGVAGDVRAAEKYLEAKAKHRGWGKETKTLNVGLNVNDLSVEELQQIVAGEIPEKMR